MISYEDAQLLDDPKYRQYSNAVEKVLRSFESSSEWADLISALGKLNKVLNSKFNAIPKKITVGKRLAQCMHPALPGGVHLKALEVYNTIFNILESKRLKYDLYIYTMGIFPLFVHASMQVRPKLLKLLETHLLPIEEGLVSCLDGMLLGLLPGLEEGTEHFQRLDTLLEKFCEKVGEMEYYGSLWRCVLSSSYVRLAALQLVYRRFDRKKFTDDQLFIIGSNVDVMVQALSESLRDASVLTQRAALDVLVMCCPLSNIPVSKEDACVLLFSALHCILRRDMSLNRRLYSWLLGYDLAKRQISVGSQEYEEQESYFHVYSKNLLIKAFSRILVKQTSKLENPTPDFQIRMLDEMYPCRLLVNLLDKPEIGPIIIEDLLCDVFRLLRAAVLFSKLKIAKLKKCEVDDVDFKTMILPEIAKSTNILLNAFEPAYLWTFLSQQVRKATEMQQHETSGTYLTDPQSFLEICEFISLLLNLAHIEAYEEIQTIHLPNLLYDLVKALTELVEDLNPNQLKSGLETCKHVLEFCQPSQHMCVVSETDAQKSMSHRSTRSSHATPNVEEQEKRRDSVISYRRSPSDREVLQCSRLFYLFFCHLVLCKLNVTRATIDETVENIGKQKLRKSTVTLQLSQEKQKDALYDRCGSGEYSQGLMGIFRISCRLLVDFASFPIYCHGKLTPSEYFLGTKNEILGFPLWLRSLLWMMCGDSLPPSYVNCEIICSSLSALLDLIALTNSSITNSHTSGSSLSGKITVVVLPPLTPGHVATFKNTSFYQLMTKKLWQMLDDSGISSHHLSAVRLLIRLHSMCPDGRCEEVLLEELVHHDKDVRTQALSKFCRLWHYTRHLLSNKAFFQGFRFKNFTRCLYATIDTLSLTPAPHHNGAPAFEADASGQAVEFAVASAWLRHCLEERDLVRVLEPLLSIALHPKTHSTLVHSRTDLEVQSVGYQSTAGLIEVKALPKSSSNQKSANFDKTSKPNSYMEFRNRIVEDIAKGKESYQDLVMSLTSLTSSNSDEIMMEQADQLVKCVIKSSLSLLSQESREKDSPSPLPAEDDTIASIQTVTEEQSLMQFAIDMNMEIASENKGRKRDKLGLVDHMLVYQEHIDSNRCLYALRSLRNLLLSQPMLFTYACVISPINSLASQSTVTSRLQDLILRHVKSMLGEPFYEEPTTRPQNAMAIDALLVICIRSMRAWMYPNCSIAPGSLHDLRCAALSLLSSLLGQLSNLLCEPLSISGMTSSASMSSSSMTSRQFTMFVRSLLSKYDLGKTVMACLESSVMALQTLEDDNDEIKSLSSRRSPNKALVPAKDGHLALWWCGGEETRVKSFQHHLIGVVQQIFILEHRLITSEHQASEPSEASESRIPLIPNDGFLIRLQPLVFSALLRILRLQHSCDVHAVWLDLMTFSLPYITDSMPEVASSLTSQICRNLEHTINLFTGCNKRTSISMNQIPADYVVTLLKSMQALIHSTLFIQSASHGVRSVYGTSGKTSNLSSATPSQSPSSAPFSALGSFFGVFSSGNSSSKTSRANDDQSVSSVWLLAKKATLRNLPKILGCLALVWDKVVAKSNSNQTKGRKLISELNPCTALGEKESVSQSILQILNPISLQYGENLICALSMVWEKRGRNELRQTDIAFSRDHLSEQQNQLLNLACHTRSLHCDVTLNLVKNVILQPPEVPSTVTSKRRKVQYEERLLHFAYLFIQLQPTSTLQDSWSSLLSLLKECVALALYVPPSTNSSASRSSGSSDRGRLTPRCYFLLLFIVAEIVKKVPPFEDKRYQKDLQDVCVKCIEACNAIVDRSLEHGGWLGRRSPAVLASSVSSNGAEHNGHSKREALADVPSMRSDFSYSTVVAEKEESSISTEKGTFTLRLQSVNYQSTVQALMVLSQVLANVLDVAYGSEEKEKTIPILTSVMANVVPFLRTRSYKNAPSFRAASSLLASISGYQHTRRSWKREIYEIFLSPDFFRMSFESITDWCSIIDHLMTHDVTTFKDFMAALLPSGIEDFTSSGTQRWQVAVISKTERSLPVSWPGRLVRLGTTRSTTTGASLNIFSNREQELEQRAMLLKRLAFIIFSSASNQYQRLLPEIQERLSESIKLLQVPTVQEQVFLCFRVLLLRFSPSNLTSLWPSIITELVHTLRDLEFELIEIEIETTLANINNKSKNSTTARSGGTTTSHVNLPQHEKWLALYLSACKLLDLALSLQAKHLQHFKLFRWSFVGESDDVIEEVVTSSNQTVRGSRKKEDSDNKAIDELEPFVPHCVRIKRLMAQKNPSGAKQLLPVVPLQPLLEMKKVESVDQLQSFFNTIVDPSTMIKQYQHVNQSGVDSKSLQKTTATTERVLWRDFLDEIF